MAMIAPYRKLLPFRTMFNILGPLINPANPRGMVVGVAERELGNIFAQSLRDGGVENAYVVCGAEGLDEISCAGDTHAWELKAGVITVKTIHPSDFGLPTHSLSEVAGGTPEENALTLESLLNSGHSISTKLEPVLDFVLLNASAVLVVAGLASDFKTGVELAKKSIYSGKAWEALQIFRRAGMVIEPADEP